MTTERKAELFDNMLEYIWMHNEADGKVTYILALQNVGFTPEEIQEELANCDFEDETDDNKCPLGGDISNDCADCVYACDYHFVDGECVRREK